jgi:hypothetical protein
LLNRAINKQVVEATPPLSEESHASIERKVMILKIKVLGLGALVGLAASAVATVNASATSTGHFYSHSSTVTEVEGTELGTHFLELTLHGFEGAIFCEAASYLGFMGTTATSIDVFDPEHKTCRTTGQGHGTTKVHVNDCGYTLTPGHVGTVHIDCEPGRAIEITHPNCTITIVPQTVSGITYTPAEESGKRYITLDASAVQFAGQFHAGICVFTGTNHTGTLHGSVTARGFHPNTFNQVDITHTAT